MNYQTIGYLERGEYNPSLDLALRAAEYFGLPVEAIFSRRPFAPMSAQLYGSSIDLTANPRRTRWRQPRSRQPAWRRRSWTESWISAVVRRRDPPGRAAPPRRPPARDPRPAVAGTWSASGSGTPP